MEKLWNNFKNLSWLDGIIKFCFSSVSRTSRVLITIALIGSSNDFYSNGAFLAKDTLFNTIWMWALSISLDSAALLVFSDFVRMIKKREWILSIVFALLSIAIGYVVGMTMFYDMFAHATNQALTDVIDIPVWWLVMSRVGAILLFLMTFGFDELSYKETKAIIQDAREEIIEIQGTIPVIVKQEQKQEAVPQQIAAPPSLPAIEKEGVKGVPKATIVLTPLPKEEIQPDSTLRIEETKQEEELVPVLALLDETTTRQGVPTLVSPIPITRTKETLGPKIIAMIEEYEEKTKRKIAKYSDLTMQEREKIIEAFGCSQKTIDRTIKNRTAQAS